MQNLIERIRRKSLDEAALKSKLVFGRSKLIQPVAIEGDVVSAEIKLGLRMPTLLRECYLQIGNGGFGANAGAIGFGESGKRCHFDYDPWPSSPCDIVEITRKYSKLYGEWKETWSESWLVFMDLSGGSMGIVDCHDGTVLVHEVEEGIVPLCGSIEEYFENWLNDTFPEVECDNEVFPFELGGFKGEFRSQMPKPSDQDRKK